MRHTLTSAIIINQVKLKRFHEAAMKHMERASHVLITFGLATMFFCICGLHDNLKMEEVLLLVKHRCYFYIIACTYLIVAESVLIDNICFVIENRFNRIKSFPPKQRILSSLPNHLFWQAQIELCCVTLLLKIAQFMLSTQFIIRSLKNQSNIGLYHRRIHCLTFN